MKQRYCKIFHILFLLIPLLFIGHYGFTIETPRIGPSPVALSLAAESVPLPIDTLMDYALLLSEVPEGELSSYEPIVEDLIRNLDAYYEERRGESAPGDIVLAFMHENAVQTYREEQTRFDVLLKSGVYNCVSSSLLYTILARSIGLTVGMVNTSDHVFCLVETEEGPVDVETTNVYGYDPGEKKEFHDKFGRTGYAYVPPGNYALRNETDDKGLLAFILQNRIADLERRNAYAEAAALAVDRNAILGTESSYVSMVKEFINYAAWLNREGQYRDALNFIETVQKRYGEDHRYKDISSILINNRMTVLVQDEQYEAAFEFLRTMVDRNLLDNSSRDNLFRKVEDRRIYTVIRELAFDEALAEIRESFHDRYLSGQRYEEYIEFLYLTEAEEIVRNEGWLAAIPLIEEGRDLLPNSPKLKQAEESFRYNFVVRVHNQFAELYNDKQYEQAAALLDEALRKLPANKTLLQDKKVIEKTLESLQ